MSRIIRSQNMSNGLKWSLLNCEIEPMWNIGVKCFVCTQKMTHTLLVF